MKKDLHLPLWGPYGKKYAGVSKITEVEGFPAARLDFLTVPGVMGFGINVPNATVPSAFHPWEASADLSYYSFRHELEWKDRVYADVSYTKLDGGSFLVRTELFNNTEKQKNFVVNYFYSLELPTGRPFEPALPEKRVFIDAADYAEYEYAIGRPWDEQNADGMKKGVFPDSRFSRGRGLGDRAEKWHVPHILLKPFGGEKGDRVSYEPESGESFSDPVLVVRYRSVALRYTGAVIDGVEFTESVDTAVFSVCGRRLVLPPSDEPAYAVLPIETVPERLELVSEGSGAVELDFFVICESSDARIVTSKLKNDAPAVPEYVPETTFVSGDGISMHSVYRGCGDELFLKVFDPDTRHRTVATGCLEDCLSSRMSNPDESFDDLTESFIGELSRKRSDEGFFENAITHTIIVDPGSSAVRYAVISTEPVGELSPDELEAKHKKARDGAKLLSFSPEGERYAFSCRLLGAALMTNVVYPIYKHGEYIIHFTPGKRWDCLYTWDSGFIGLGMNELSPDIADYVLDTYLSEESNPDYAFLHHGSPVPTQIYQFWEMLQKRNGKEELLALYPRLRLYYLFFAGKIRGSTTAKLKSGLLTTYDYFYSCSGMDDYPPQVAMMEQNIRGTTAPAITTATAIRFAKTLLVIAGKLGLAGDESEYRSDIAAFTEALNRYSWDEEEKWFSYVLHDEDLEPTGIFRFESGENLNRGLDGVYPLIAGICGDEQKAALLSHLGSEDEMLCRYGISAVDRSAPYFRVNGYWNGNIWFPHQWIIWKSMLDIGEADFAFEIARRALEIWKREVEDSYYTFEMVSVTTGSGGWFHNFGGLSTPILLWAKAYYSPGTLNVGFDTFVERFEFGGGFTSLTAELSYHGSEKESVILAVMEPGREYSVTLDGEEVPFVMRTDGCAEIRADLSGGKELKIREKG